MINLSWGSYYSYVFVFSPDGRNHEGCCMRAGITEHCQPLCNYAMKDPEHMTRDYTECIMQGLLIAQCLTEGQGKEWGRGRYHRALPTTV